MHGLRDKSLENTFGVSESRPREPPLTTSQTLFWKTHPDWKLRTPTELSEDEGPHITAKSGDETESRPLPATNYKWAGTVRPERVVPELESHIEGLKKRRQNYAREAEMLWHWLAEKEGEYYGLCEHSVGLDDEQEKQNFHMYLQILGVQHSLLWSAVSKMDWAIADFQKRIAQHQARTAKEGQGAGEICMPRAPSAKGDQCPITAIKSS